MKSIGAKKSYKEGHVSVRINLKARGWQSASLNVQGDMDLSSTEAREFAKELIAEADRADAKVAAKAASEARRKKWRDREVAAGRLKIVELGSLFGRQHS